MSPSDLVAVLFTDLVASTELMTTLGDRSYDDLRRGHFAALSEAIRAHHGEEVKNTGDGIMAVFSAAVDAVEAAVALQHATARHSRRASVPLAIRVGLALGDVTREDGDIFGTPVVEAARLVSAARPGQILATSLLRAVTGARCATTFADLGTLELKGLPEPVAVCEVVWEQWAPPVLALPPLLASVGRVFVGREAELEELSQLWKEAAAGERRLALLAGESGIGKTRLAAHLAHTVHETGAMVLAGRCDEDLGVPYQPFVEALRHYALNVRNRSLGRHAGELSRLVPELPSLVPGLPEPMRSDPETERYRLFDALASWLGDLSVETTVLLVLDDLHWAAKPTLLLLRHILRAPDSLRLLVVATYRDTDVGRGHPLAELLADLRRETGVQRISLTGLDLPAVSAFIEAAAGHELDADGEALARVVAAETEGNAFFVTEVLRHLVESGALEQRQGRWIATSAIADVGIPEGVRDVVGRRLSRLSEEANQVLALASVAGLEFEPAVVQAAGALPEDVVLSALEEAAAARVVVEVPGSVPRNRFVHTLVRSALYDELSAARRVALHRRLAEAIEAVHRGRLDDYLPALAHHWARASAPAAETSKAVEYATRAGNRALAQLANDEAADYYAQALELLAASPASAGSHRTELLIALGEAQRRAGIAAYRETLLTAARLAKELGDGAALVRAAVANSRGAVFATAGSVDSERIRVLEEALETEGLQSAQRARLLATLGLELTWTDRDRRIRASDEALVLARGLDDERTLAEVLLGRYYAIVGPDNWDERRVNSEELLALAERLGDAALHSQALALRMRLAVESGDVDEASRVLEMNEGLTGRLHQPTLQWFVALQKAGHALNCGHLQTAEHLVDEAWELGRRAGQPDADLIHVWQRFSVTHEQGRIETVVDDLARHAQGAPEYIGVQSYRDVVTALVARAFVEAGRVEEAGELLEPLASSGFSLPLNSVWLRGITDCAAAWAAIGDRDRAELLEQMLAPYPGQFTTAALSVTTGCVSHYLGLLAAMLGRLDEAEKRFAFAEAAHHRARLPAWLSRTRIEWARMLLRRASSGDAARARILLEQALATGTDFGLGAVERQAAALLEGKGH